METLLFAILVGILFTAVITTLRPRSAPPVVYIATPKPEAPASELGCLPIMLICVLTLLVLMAMRG